MEEKWEKNLKDRIIVSSSNCMGKSKFHVFAENLIN